MPGDIGTNTNLNDKLCLDKVTKFPPGLLGEVAHWVLSSASYPNVDIALVTAIALISGFTGRAYNTFTGAGLNQYILLLASTGMGKELIALATGEIFAEVAKLVVAASSFKGPSHIASVQALIKWLSKNPAILCIFGEFGQKLKAMARNPSPNDTALLAGYLEFYSKSGAGGVIDPMAYSDRDKNTNPITAPSLTIVGETVPGEFYDNLDERMIANGLLPRFLIFEVTGRRPYFNRNPVAFPPAKLIQQLADLASQCISLAHNGSVHVVPADNEASAKFADFEIWTTDKINQSSSEVHKQLWNRANLKALKLASIYAIGENYLNPVVGIAATMWATNMVVSQTEHLLGKFERNEVGVADGDQTKQRSEVLRIIHEYVTTAEDLAARYAVDDRMRKAGIITQSYIAKRLFTLPTFKNDKQGPTAALKRTLMSMLADDEIIEIPSSQMAERFSCKPRAFTTIGHVAAYHYSKNIQTGIGGKPSFFDD